MARPIVKRTLETYSRNIAELKVLRTAIMIDESLDRGRADAAIASIARTIDALEALCATLRRAA